MNFGILILAPAVLFCSLSWAEIQKSSLDFSKATVNPETGGLCIMQEVCIDDLSALAKNLPPGPCIQNGENFLLRLLRTLLLYEVLISREQ